VEEATEIVTQLGRVLWTDWWWTVVRVQQLFRQTPGCILVSCHLSQLFGVEFAPRSVDLGVGDATGAPVGHAIALGSSPLPVNYDVLSW